MTKRRITKEDAERFLTSFMSAAPSGLSADVVGSVKNKGWSEKDLDILIFTDEDKLPDELLEIDEPAHYPTMRTIGATLEQSDIFGSGSEWWMWEGILIDCFFEEAEA